MGAKRSRYPAGQAAGRFAFEGLERVIHEKARLGIMTSLAAHASGVSFADLKQLCGLTDGNLNRHLKVLCDAGLVEVRKESAGGRAQTICRVTPHGRTRFLEYLDALEQAVADAAQAARRSPAAQAARHPLPRLRPA